MVKEVQIVKIVLVVGILIRHCLSDNCSPCTWITWGKCQSNNVIERQVCCPADIVATLNTTGKVSVLGCVKECRSRNIGNVYISDKMTRSCHYNSKSTTVKTTTLPTTLPTTTTTTTTSTAKVTTPASTTRTTLQSTVVKSTTSKATTTTTVPSIPSTGKQSTSTTANARTTGTSSSKPPTTTASVTTTAGNVTARTTGTPSSKPPTTTASVTSKEGNVTAKGRIQGPSGKAESSSSPLPGAIGGVIGVLLLAAVASGVFYFLWKRKKRGRDEKVHPSTPDLKEAETKDAPPMENGAPPSDHRV